MNNVVVRFYNGRPGSLGTHQVGTDQHIGTLASFNDEHGGGSVMVQTTFDAPSPLFNKTYQIYAEIDPDHHLDEMTRDNNLGYVPLVVTSGDPHATEANLYIDNF